MIVVYKNILHVKGSKDCFPSPVPNSISKDFSIFHSLGQVQDFGEMSFNVIINPFKPHGNSHSYQLDLSISILRVVVFFIFIQISIEYSVRKQWRP